MHPEIRARYKNDVGLLKAETTAGPDGPYYHLADGNYALS
jgi:hypothetical protein